MTPAQWARVLRAGADAIPVSKFRSTDGLTPDLYPIAATRWALYAMAGEADKISEETQLTETEDSQKIAAFLRAWQAEGGDERAVQLQRIIRAWCAQATEHGISVARQKEMLNHYGIALGGGGHGRDPDAPPCAYCGATEEGGHGGLCPNGSTGIDGAPGGPNSGGGGAGCLGAWPLPAGEVQT
jgi:hypothetical protein